MIIFINLNDRFFIHAKEIPEIKSYRLLYPMLLRMSPIVVKKANVLMQQDIFNPGVKKMEILYDAGEYPSPVLSMIRETGDIGIAIANWWKLGWPERVAKLLAQKIYEIEFRHQFSQVQNIFFWRERRIWPASRQFRWW